MAPPADLRSWIALLERERELVRVAAEVDPDLEATEIVDRTVKAGGPALLSSRRPPPLEPGRDRVGCAGEGAPAVEATMSPDRAARPRAPAPLSDHPTHPPPPPLLNRFGPGRRMCQTKDHTPEPRSQS